MFGFGYRISFLETSLNINKVLVTQSCSTLWDHMHYSPPWTIVLCPWDFPGKNTGMDCHSLLQGIFLTQALNPCFLHFRQIVFGLNHQGICKHSAFYIRDLGIQGFLGLRGSWKLSLHPYRWRAVVPPSLLYSPLFLSPSLPTFPFLTQGFPFTSFFFLPTFPDNA